MSVLSTSHPVQSGRHRLRRAVVIGVAVLALAAGSLFSATERAQALTPLPCDIYASASSPCVAAYSSVRALYDTYSGSLYQVTRASEDRKSVV